LYKKVKEIIFKAPDLEKLLSLILNQSMLKDKILKNNNYIKWLKTIEIKTLMIKIKIQHKSYI
jgi:hypothetical protein